MIWNGYAEFAAMGGYALYVWGSVIAVAAALAAELALLAARRRAALAAARTASPCASGREGAGGQPLLQHGASGSQP